MFCSSKSLAKETVLVITRLPNNECLVSIYISLLPFLLVQMFTKQRIPVVLHPRPSPSLPNIHFQQLFSPFCAAVCIGRWQYNQVVSQYFTLSNYTASHTSRAKQKPQNTERKHSVIQEKSLFSTCIRLVSFYFVEKQTWALAMMNDRQLNEISEARKQDDSHTHAQSHAFNVWQQIKGMTQPAVKNSNS